jgi:hypothetical protein
MKNIHDILLEYLPELDEVVEKTLEIAGKRGVEIARSTTLFNHGDSFNAAITYTQLTSHSGLVDADPVDKKGVHYGAFLEYGTRPHIIEAKNAKTLRFEVDGDVIFAKRVHHPGTKAYGFMEKSGEQLESELPDIFDAVFNTIIKE